MMSTKVTPLSESPRPRGNKFFLEQGLVKKIQYNISLAKSQNPDHKLRYPNECDIKNVNRIADITKRVTKEFQLFQEVRKLRRIKAGASPRRIKVE